MSIGLGVTALVCAIGFFALLGMNALMDGKLATARAQLARGTMMPPLSEQELRIAPDHVPGLDQAGIMVRRENAVLYALRIDMSYARQQRFRDSVDKRDQGRVLVINNLSKDSNGDLRVCVQHVGARRRSLRHSHRGAAAARSADRGRLVHHDGALSPRRRAHLTDRADFRSAVC